MYRFRHLNATYAYTSVVTTSDGRRSEYRATVPICAIPNLLAWMTVSVHVYQEETIDGLPLTGFDKLMSDLWQGTHPIGLNVQKDGTIESLDNYDEMHARWQTACAEVLLSNPDAYWVSRYIKESSKNMSTESSCLELLKRSGFMQYFFIDEGIREMDFVSYGFPKSGDRIPLHFELKLAESGTYHYNFPIYNSPIGNMDTPVRIGDGDMRICYTEKGFLEWLTCRLLVEVAGEGYYIKEMTLNLMATKK